MGSEARNPKNVGSVAIVQAWTGPDIDRLYADHAEFEGKGQPWHMCDDGYACLAPDCVCDRPLPEPKP